MANALIAKSGEYFRVPVRGLEQIVPFVVDYGGKSFCSQ
jgi:hypothetical protein